ncbi:MAG: NAD(P)-dependent oxidoreductase [Hyphomicrobiales bacterium]|nr:MAG: NAD(P)-dependent oxidoreductase [Hyphomicrobiales bacterium]
MKKILIFGMGYVGQHLAAALDGQYQVIGTSREALSQNQINWNAAEATESSNQAVAQQILQADAILCSIPPDENGDVVYAQFGELIKKSNVKWLGYLSTTGVYGDHQGGKVDETTPLNAQNTRAKKRISAETQWQKLANNTNQVNSPTTTERSVHIFRLPGIYGVGRSAFEALTADRAKRIDMRLKHGPQKGEKHFFCRSHVDDIVQVIVASLKKQLSGINIYNIVDDLPAPQADIVKYAAKLMGAEVPNLLSEPQADMSDMAKSFYAECKNMQNNKIKTELGVSLKHPDYKQGLSAIWQQIKA